MQGGVTRRVQLRQDGQVVLLQEGERSNGQVVLLQDEERERSNG